MAKRKYKLKELQVRIPVKRGFPRTQELDDLAYESAQELSATPVKRFRYLGTGYSAFSNEMRDLIYSAFGTPKEDQ